MADIPSSGELFNMCPACGNPVVEGAAQCGSCGQVLRPAPSVQPSAPMFVPTPAKPTPGMAISAMVLGICSLVFWCVPFVSAALALLGIIFGLMSLRQHKGMALTGVLCGIVHFVIWGTVVLIAIAAAGGISHAH